MSIEADPTPKRRITSWGELSCPSGILLLADAGATAVWPTAPTDRARPLPEPELAEVHVTGPDARTAVRKALATKRSAFYPLRNQPGPWLYDLDLPRASELVTSFTGLCLAKGQDARMTLHRTATPLAERARRATADLNFGSFTVAMPGAGSTSVLAVAGLPADQPLRLGAWASPDEPDLLESVEARLNWYRRGQRRLGDLLVDGGAIVLGDLGALTSAAPEQSEDGLADLTVHRLPAEAATALAVPRLSDYTHGWVDLAQAEAAGHADRLRQWRAEHAAAIDIRLVPHSAAWLLDRRLAESSTRSAMVEVAGGGVLVAHTRVGDGRFPVDIWRDKSGTPTSFVIFF